MVRQRINVWVAPISGLFFVGLLIFYLGYAHLWHSEMLKTTEILPETGYAYIVNMSELPYSDDQSGGTSPLQVFEGDELLMLAHASHADIRSKGRGRFSHWGNSVRFSASDNSDPRINGRAYSLRYPAWAPSLWMLVVSALFFLLSLMPLIKNARRSLPAWKVAIVHALKNSELKTPKKLLTMVRWSYSPWLNGLVVVVFVCLLLLRFGVVNIWHAQDISPTVITHESGYAYLVEVPELFYSDDQSGGRSSLQILEDGKPLVSAHAPHADIRSKGMGRFSHWGNSVRFSASDNSDPRVNGREYVIHSAWKPSVLLLVLFMSLSLLALLLSSYVRRVAFVLQKLQRVHPGWIALSLILLALAYRLAVASALWNGSFDGVQVQGSPYTDAYGWWASGESLEYGQDLHPALAYWDARRQGYAWFLGAIFSLFGDSLTPIRIIQILLGAVSAGLIFDMLRRMTPIPVAVLASLIHVFLAYDVRSALTTMSEPLGYFLSNLALWLFVFALWTFSQANNMRRTLCYLGLAGAVLAMANMVRPLNIMGIGPLALFAGYFVVQSLSQMRWRGGLMAVFAVVLGASVVLAPWMLRQHHEYGFWALSDNGVEALYAATTPEYGTWTSEVTSRAGTELQRQGLTADIRNRYFFFKQGINEHLHEHLTWYIGHALTSTWRQAQVIHPERGLMASGLFLLFLFAWYRSRQLKIIETSIGVGLMLLILLLPEQLYVLFSTLVFLVASGWAVIRVHPMGLPALLLISTLLSLGMMALDTSERFNHSIEWLAGAMALYGLWVMLRMRSGCLSNRQSWMSLEDDRWRGYWWIKRVSALAMVILFSGSMLMLVTKIYPRTIPDHLNISSVERKALLSDFFARNEVSEFGLWQSNIVIFPAAFRPKHPMSFKANENISHWSPWFIPRPYPFTIYYNFQLRKICGNQSESRLVFAREEGDVLPAIGGAYYFAGICNPKTAGQLIEVIAVKQAGKNGAWVFPKPALAEKHYNHIKKFLVESTKHE